MCSLSSLKNCIENEIKNGFTRFMVGDHGRFDFEVKNLLVGLKREYKHIELVWVLTSVNKYVELEKERRNYRPYDYLIYDIENMFYKKIISYTNKNMVDESELIISCVDENNSMSGACKALRYARKKKKLIINLYNVY